MSLREEGMGTEEKVQLLGLPWDGLPLQAVLSWENGRRRFKAESAAA